MRINITQKIKIKIASKIERVEPKNKRFRKCSQGTQYINFSRLSC